MPYCPDCHQSVNDQAITCPHCRSLLKAHGHPGIPLHRAVDEVPLCATCLYDLDNTCTFPQRPNARECTLYRDQSQASRSVNVDPLTSQFGPSWFRRNGVWAVLVGLGAIALLLAL